MRMIYKYEVNVTEDNSVSMPRNARILHVNRNMNDPDLGKFWLWAEVDHDAPIEVRQFQVFGTGHPIPSEPKHTYVGTAHANSLVWHLYEVATR